MNKTIKTIIAIIITAVASYFVATAVIPERSEVERQHADVDVPEYVPVPAANDTRTETVATDTQETADVEQKAPAPAQPTQVVQLQAVQLEAVQLTHEQAQPQAVIVPPTAAAQAPAPATQATPNPDHLRSYQPPATPTASAQTAPAPTPPPEPAPAPEPARPRRGGEIRVETSAVAANVVDRTPRGVSDRFSKSETNMIYFFTHVTGARDTTAVVHRWYREGRLVQTSVLQVRSPNWRTHSRRNLTNIPNVPDPAGNWRVEAVDQRTGAVLATGTFVVE